MNRIKLDYDKISGAKPLKKKDNEATYEVVRQHCRIAISADAPLIWNVVVRAPEGSLYFPGVFQVQIEFADKYPFKAPTFRLLTGKFKHINVDPHENSFCVDALGIGSKWSPVNSAADVLYAFVQQLREPSVDGAANAELAKLMTEDPAAYKQTIAAFVKSEASKVKFPQ
eukprot:INCI10597.1.p1 GENE.INCI10597.1~~INCI10597.1.p1  ORF type:complete len:170 (-),score=32.47 INCI10597.1:157-666(-)